MFQQITGVGSFLDTVDKHRGQVVMAFTWENSLFSNLIGEWKRLDTAPEIADACDRGDLVYASDESPSIPDAVREGHLSVSDLSGAYWSARMELLDVVEGYRCLRLRLDEIVEMARGITPLSQKSRELLKPRR